MLPAVLRAASLSVSHSTDADSVAAAMLQSPSTQGCPFAHSDAHWGDSDLADFAAGSATPTTREAPGTSLDLLSIMSAVEETAYSWDLATDRLEWEENALSVLGIPVGTEIGTGAAFQALITPEHVARRSEAIERAGPPDASRGVPYRIKFKILPGGRRSQASLWLEETGRWWAGVDGKPTRARGVVRVITDRYWEEQRLLQRSDEDELTGQLNRVRLAEAVATVIGRSQRLENASAFLVVAVNNLGVVNTNFGFDVGDEVIAAVGRLIKEKLRAGDTLGRYSSNKFGVILNDCTRPGVRTAAERFMAAVREARIQTSACPLSASISIGVVMMPEDAATASEALTRGLEALDRAKRGPLEGIEFYDRTLGPGTLRQRNAAIAESVMSALKDGRMRFVLQPLVATATGQPAIYECLLRLVKSDGTLSPAGDFIPVAEQLGLSRLIDRRTLELAVDLLLSKPDIHLSLNVSSLTTADKEWLAALRALTRGDRSVTRRLTVEITETTIIHDLDQAALFVDTLRELGCRVAIDDFGAGYTSFKNLKVLKVDMLKIDGAFVKDITTDPSGQVFIRTMIDVARTFGMETVAEWVADAESAAFLKGAGVTYLQGFHCGPPVDVSEVQL